jgi:hypothetical protein
MLIKVALLTISVVFLSGCAAAKVMDAKYSSEVDPDFSFAADKNVAVSVSEQNNSLEAKYYVGKVVEALKQRGFVNAHSQAGRTILNAPIDIMVVINVEKETKSYQYQSADLGMVNSGNTTVNCNAYGRSVNCSENNQQTVGITGYSTKTGYVTVYYFSADWINVKDGKNIMRNFASSYEEDCLDRAIYEFLISQTIARLEFDKPNEYKYSVKMPKNYNCNY